MEHPYLTHQNWNEYEYVVLHCMLCENEYKWLFNILEMFYCFSTEQNREVGTWYGYHLPHNVK